MTVRAYFLLLKPFWLRLTALALLSALSATLELTGLGGGLLFVLGGTGSASFDVSLPLAALAVGLSLVAAAVLRSRVDLMANAINCEIERGSRRDLIAAITQTAWSTAREYSQGRWISLMMSESTMVANGAGAFANAIATAAALAPLTIAALVTAPTAIILFVVLAFLGIIATRRTRATAIENEEHIRTFASVVGEQAAGLLAAMKSVFASRQTENWAGDFNSTVDDLFKLRRQQLSVGPRNRLILDLVTAFGITSLVVWVAVRPEDLAKIGLVSAVVYRSMPRIQSLQQSLMVIKVQKVWLDKWQETLTVLRQEQGIQTAQIVEIPAWNTINIDVMECTQDGLTQTVAAYDIVINQGEIVRLMGESGSGKSTFLDTLLGLLPALNTSIRVNGISVEDWNSSSLGRVEYVPQNNALGVGSLRDILVGTSGVSDFEIQDALADAELLDVVGGLQDGLNTQVISLWSSLSGGERQRFGLARAILAGPKLLVLDEATSGIDQSLEERILANLRRRATDHGFVVVFVTHRESSFEFDREWVVSAGLLVEKD